ncbi:hypothetical protein pipiens_000588, partial [Culex pipiens pipiens]
RPRTNKHEVAPLVAGNPGRHAAAGDRDGPRDAGSAGQAVRLCRLSTVVFRWRWWWRLRWKPVRILRRWGWSGQSDGETPAQGTIVQGDLPRAESDAVRAARKYTRGRGALLSV